MARNGSGTYTKVNTFVASQPITAAGHNQNFDDIALELTNSVAADGQTTMTGALKAASGTVSAPGIGFASDPNTGIYRIGSDNLGIAANGAKVVDVATTGVAVTGTLSATGVASQAGIPLMLPVGVTFPYAGGTAPTGYLLCYGQAVSRTTYAALFAVISTTYGVGDGSTTFNLPDLRGRVIAGVDTMGGSPASRLTDATSNFGDTLGEVGGAQTHTLVTANLPPYTPAGTNASGAATFTYSAASFASGANAVHGTSITGSGGSTTITTTFTQPTFTGTAQGGTSKPASIVQPTMVLNYIIFAGV